MQKNECLFGDGDLGYTVTLTRVPIIVGLCITMSSTDGEACFLVCLLVPWKKTTIQAYPLGSVFQWW